jgi:hypothetical protein
VRREQGLQDRHLERRSQAPSTQAQDAHDPILADWQRAG